MKFIVNGNKKLNGNVDIKGAKNAALKIIPASILASSLCVIKNIPQITDIEKLLEILKGIGSKVEFKDGVLKIGNKDINSFHPDEKLVNKFRGSIVLIGPLLARFGEAVLSEPGGCLIGSRPIDDHLDLFEQMGVGIEYKDNKFYFHGKPKSGHIVLKKMSVTATENAIMASVFSKGITKIHIAAAEPEIKDLADFLNKMGAKIKGAGTNEIEIEGVDELKGAEYEVLPDRIEMGTYLIAGILTNSEITVGPIISCHSDLFFKKLKDVGAKFEIIEKDGKKYVRTLKRGDLIPQNIDPRPYPGFATDLQPQYAVLMTQAQGKTEIFDTMFEGRFRYIEELKLMKVEAEILNPNKAIINGPAHLKGAEVSCLDIRAGVAVVLASLIAEGKTTINNIEFIDRGYEDIDGKLRELGADIKRE
ncbi:MAG: UDP-N-acetylglucosamine 1-carboxyvinyltransferase [Candidatus Paceibacterota bacterium]|jgi:UDP-N-acetylglucosamine 1-carboxyvinyltransferase